MARIAQAAVDEAETTNQTAKAIGGISAQIWAVQADGRRLDNQKRLIFYQRKPGIKGPLGGPYLSSSAQHADRAHVATDATYSRNLCE